MNNNVSDKTYIPLTPFKGWVLENFPFIEADFDAINNYQLMCKVTEYLNNVISNQNQVQELGTELVTAYNQLLEYVNNYFDNLDIQEEVNTKLDEMVEDGTLTNIIRTYIDPYIEQQNDQILSINNKVNAVASGSPAGVYTTLSALQSADPDHSKIYLVSGTGHWYYYTNNTWTDGGVYQSSLDTTELNILQNDVTGIKNGYETFGSYSEAKVGTFVNGEYRTDNLKRVACIDLMHFDRPITIHVASGYQANILKYTSEGVYQTDLAYVTDTYTIPTSVYFKVLIKLVDETGALVNPDIAVFLSKVTFKTLIQEQFDAIDSDITALETTDTQIKSNNYEFNITRTDGIYITRINNTGYFAPDEYSCATDFIEVMPNTIVKLSKLLLSGNRTVATYDKNKNTVACLTDASSGATEMIINVGENVRYIRATGRINISPEFEYLSLTTEKDMEEYIKTNGYTVLYEQATKYPVISFIDDDTAGMDYVTNLKEICDDVGIKISFAGLTSNIGDSNYQGAFINLMLDYERQGFPTIMHGYSQGSFYQMANRDLEDCEDDLVHGIQDMTKWGFTDFKACWATPYGEYDEQLKSLAYKWGFESLVRYTSQEQVEDPTKLNPQQRYELYRFTFESTSNVSTIKSLIDKAIACKGWLIIGLHSSYDYTQGNDFPDDLAEVVNYATNNGCQVRTVNEELRRRMPIYNNYEKY